MKLTELTNPHCSSWYKLFKDNADTIAYFEDSFGPVEKDKYSFHDFHSIFFFVLRDRHAYVDTYIDTYMFKIS